MRIASPAALILLLALMGLLNSLCSDMLIPALPVLQADMGINSWQAQQTISLFFIASAFMSLWYGAIADSHGRRRTILAALVILSLSAGASTLTHDIETLWVLRVAQGLAAGAGMVISRAILHDLHHGPEAQHLLGRITLLQILSLIATPVIGAWLGIHFGWQSVFVVLALITAVMTLIYWLWLPETLPAEQQHNLSPGTLVASYLRALRTPRFVFLSIAHVANWTSMAIYVVSAPAIIVTLLGRPATDIYLIYAPIALGLSCGFLFFPKLLRGHTGLSMLTIAYRILATSVLLNLMITGVLPASDIVVFPLFAYSFGLAIALPILISDAMEPLRQNAGIASSLQTFLQFAMIALASGCIAPLLWGSLFSLALGTGMLTLIGGVAVLRDHYLRRQAPATPPPHTS